MLTMASAKSADSTATSVAVREDHYPAKSSSRPKFFPRRWMLPKLSGGNWKSFNFFSHEDEEVIRLKDDHKKFELSLDLHQYRPDEIAVNVADGVLSVDAKHVAKSEGKFESMEFNRSYTLPKQCRAEDVSSNLSSDGVLVIMAPKTAGRALEHRK